MLTSLKLTGFRNFEDFSLNHLTRVNLLVGTNNAGKTTVLEGANILLAGGAPYALLQSLVRRGEMSLRQLAGGGIAQEGDICHLFYGHKLEDGAKFRLEGFNEQRLFVEQEIVPLAGVLSEPTPLPVTQPGTADMTVLPPLALKIINNYGALPLIPLSASGGLNAQHQRIGVSEDWRMVINFLPSGQLVTFALGSSWDQIVLTPEEGRVIQALRIIEPAIERIAALSSSPVRSTPEMYVKLAGSDTRFPLGSMGDGIRRLLALAISLVNSADGYLLVDEIDTGFHYSIMVNMWKLIVETARRLNIQVLATTHSQDCVLAMAALFEKTPDVRDEISLHRIEKGANTSIRYSVEEILEAAHHNMELR